MKIKKGVRMDGIRPEIVAIFPVVEEVYKYAEMVCVLTSAREGVHSSNSLHPKGFAVDFRYTAGTVYRDAEIANMIRDALPDEYDVIPEDDHIHVEYDLKRI